MLYNFSGWVATLSIKANVSLIQIYRSRNTCLAEMQLDTLQNLWVRAVFITLVNISLSYQKIINIQ